MSLACQRKVLDNGRKEYADINRGPIFQVTVAEFVTPQQTGIGRWAQIVQHFSTSVVCVVVLLMPISVLHAEVRSSKSCSYVDFQHSNNSMCRRAANGLLNRCLKLRGTGTPNRDILRVHQRGN